MAQGPLAEAYVNWLLTSVPWSVFMYFTVLGSVYAFIYFKEAKDREVQSALLGEQLADARLGALRTQLHPHFLFNSLNTLAVFVRERNTRAASRMLELLGDILRRLLRSDRPQEVPLAEELEFIEQYLAIEAMRFPDRLRVVWSIQPQARAARVPDMLLQPLIENAIRHGVATRTEPTRVTVAAWIEDSTLHLAVTDEGQPDGERVSEPHPGEGVGLANTRERLRTLYGRRGRLMLHPLPAGGTRVIVELPFMSIEGA